MSNSVVTEIEKDECESARKALACPELLAPAGDWECAKAAVENGADAIYFGLERFNARMRAHNFTEADLPRLMEFLHRRGVKGYVTFNTVVFANELADAEHYIRSIISAGVDAAIVQDVGICRLIRALSPDFPIHASTQMTITSAGGVEFARDLGCNLVVLARECSLKEIENIQRSASGSSPSPPRGERIPPTNDLRIQPQNGPAGSLSLGERAGVRGKELFTDQRSPGENEQLANECPALLPLPKGEGRGEGKGIILQPRASHTFDTRASLPLEVFVHGALCVAYSGQCLTSEALGGRSANRGECAQACRMPYELISDGKSVLLGDKRYLLSPQDLAGMEVLPDLIRAGVSSLKIEGRLKSPEYVANITRVYRAALDKVFGEMTGSAACGEDVIKRVAQESRYDLEMGFSRGLYTGWFRGINNQQLAHARFGKKRGVYLGKVKRIQTGRVVLDLQAPLKPGDGLVFDCGHPDQKEEGGRVYAVARRGDETVLEFGHGDIDFERVHVGDLIWKTNDPELDRRLRQTFSGDQPKFQRPITIEVHGHAEVPLTIIARDELGNVAQLASTMSLAKAEKQPLTSDRLREQLGRLGGTPLRLEKLENRIDGNVILPISELNRLRREMVQQLETLRSRPKRWQLHSDDSPTESANDSRIEALNRPEGLPLPKGEGRGEGEGSVLKYKGLESKAALIVLVRNLPQLEAALRSGTETVYCDFEDPKKYREAVRIVGEFRGNAESPTLWVAPPRIFKTGEEWILKQVRSCDADGYLVRNYDHLKFFAPDRRIGDFSLNVANGITAQYFKENFGLERLTASYDLNFPQLEALLRSSPPEWYEVTIHQHIPMFHMEHCVFCAFLSSGTDYSNCGRPCDKHDVRLRDRVGAEHILKADIGCRNTVFNALAQTGAEHVAEMQALGVRHFRIEFVNESPAQVAQIISKYGQLLRGEITGSAVWRDLKVVNQLGVTRGAINRAESR